MACSVLAYAIPVQEPNPWRAVSSVSCCHGLAGLASKLQVVLLLRFLALIWKFFPLCVLGLEFASESTNRQNPCSFHLNA